MRKLIPKPELGYVLAIEKDGTETKYPYRNTAEGIAFGGGIVEKPSTWRKVKNFVKAAVKHQKAGRPIASDEVIAKRYAICKDCPANLFVLTDDVTGVGSCQHTSCGCVVAPADYKGRHKLRWADQACPFGYWCSDP